MVAVSAAAESSEASHVSAATPHYQQPKKRGMTRPPGKFAAPTRDLPRPSSAADMQKASSSGKKNKSSEYDFPDSPEEEGIRKTPSSYMALSSSLSRSPRRGHVDSSESRSDGSSKGEGNIGSSVDEGASGDGDKVTSQSKDPNEAQGYASFLVGQQVSDSSHLEPESRNFPRSRFGGRAESGEADDSSNISHPSIDSTHSDHMVIDESDIGSSTGADVSSGGPMVDRPRSAKSSPRVHDNSPQCSTDVSYEAADNTSQSRGGSDNLPSMSYVQRSRSPRAVESSFMGVDVNNRPHSSSDLPTSMASVIPGSGDVSSYSYSNPAQPVVSSMIVETEHAVISRDQEPMPLYSAQYEMLSDDDD